MCVYTLDSQLQHVDFIARNSCFCTSTSAALSSTVTDVRWVPHSFVVRTVDSWCNAVLYLTIKIYSTNFDQCHVTVNHKDYSNRQQAVTVPFLPRDLPLRAPLPLHRFLPRPLHPIFGPLRSHALHACVTRRKRCKNQINRVMKTIGRIN